MPISWNEIRHNAVGFSRRWAGTTSETAEKQTFWNEFFSVFGLQRRLVATFEEAVRLISGKYGRIDLFWKRTLLVEHKSAGQDLGKAQSQAFQYLQDLLNEGRQDEAPRYVIVSDFTRMVLYDLEPEEDGAQNSSSARSKAGPDPSPKLPAQPRRPAVTDFLLADLHKHIHAFAFIPGYKQHKFQDQDPINLKATAIMGNLHDALEAGGYTGHQLERFLVRVLFCLFAEDTGLFERDAFRLYLENRTAEDGSDLGMHLARLFRVLDTPEDQRQQNLDETLAAFPYVNGELYREHDLDIPDFNRDMRNVLLACTRFDWSAISPAIFGSLFQAVMEPRERRQLGGHYTGEPGILKVIRPLFLDALWAEFQRLRKNKAELRRFHQRLAALRFLDPACGCGNFLVITYRELRRLELEILKELYGGQRELTLDVNKLSLVDVDQFYGLEIAEWPARIAEVALWLMDHQMNLQLSAAFGQLYRRLPLKKSPHIHQANALRVDWKTILPPEQCSYVLGNPPFIGKQFQTAEQKEDMGLVCGMVKGGGVLDYVTAWYFRAAHYIQGTSIAVGFVSTNSISQGEQVGILWGELFAKFHLKIHFAHRTFPWESEARGKAHVHVVIVGFAAVDAARKSIYDYDGDSGKVTITAARNISPYLVEGNDVVVLSRSTPLCGVPEIVFGNMPNDGGHLLLDEAGKAELLRQEPNAARFVRPFLGAEEFINGKQRWCLWLVGASPTELRSLPKVMQRVEAVRKHREQSTRGTTRELATVPALFGEIRQPRGEYLMVPSVSSENRRYIPMAFMPELVIGSNLVLFVPSAGHLHLGILSSAMHMAWVRQVCGRMKSDYRYSNRLVYNNFPWPPSPTPKQKEAVEAAAQKVLDVRAQFPGSTLADLYDPLSMPPALVKAHADLDRAVDLCYRPQPFTSERQRVEYLFALYEQLTAPLLPTAKPKRPRRNN